MKSTPTMIRLAQRISISLIVLTAFLVQGMPVNGASLLPLKVTELLSMVQIPLFPLSIAISPDGTRVAYVSIIPPPGGLIPNTGLDRGNGRTRLWVQNISGGAPIPIGPPQADNWAPVWSPDGKKLAFYTGFLDRSNVVAFWDASANRVRVTDVAVSWRADSAQWMPDSTRVLVAQVPNITKNQTMASPTTEPTTMPTPAITVFTSSPKQGNTVASGVVSQIPSSAFLTVDLTLVDSTTGDSSPVAREIQPKFYVLSPDGTKLFYTVMKGEIESDVNNRVIFDVIVVDLRNTSTVTVARDIVTGYSSGSVTWSHDGSKIAFIGGTIQRDSNIASPTGSRNTELGGSCYIIDLRHPGMLRSIGGEQLDRLQHHLLWSKDDATVYALTTNDAGIIAVSLTTGVTRTLVNLKHATIEWNGMLPPLLAAAQHIYSFVQTDEGKQLCSFDPQTGRFKVIFRLLPASGAIMFTLSNDGKRAAYLGGEATLPQNIWIVDFDHVHTYQLTHLNPQIEDRALGTIENVTWRSRSGDRLEGILLVPPGRRPSKGYPTIVFAYAGENEGSAYRNSFGIWGVFAASYSMELFVTRGYAVFVPNSTLRIGSPMKDIADTILPGVDKIIGMGIADPTRLGVYGASYGGYSVFSLIVQTHRFKAALAAVGFSDLISEYGRLSPEGYDGTGMMEDEQGRMGGTPWQYRNRYIENSPFFYLDRVQTPVLLEYGSDDFISNFNMPETFVALRRLGKTAVLVAYAGESHGLLKVSNQADFTTRELNWFAKYLK